MPPTIDFVIAGAQKCATTSLHRYLGQHPQIFMPRAKELEYFVATDHRAREQVQIETFYSSVQPGQLIGLSQVNMLFFPHVPGRIHQHNPRAKIIALLRDPVDRAYSAYWFARMQGWETCATFERALQRELHEEFTTHHDLANFTYLQHGHYADQLERYFAVFGRDRIRAWLTEDLAASPARVLSELFQWLGVSDDVDGISFQTRHNVVQRVRFRWLSLTVGAASLPARVLLRALLPNWGRSRIRHRILGRLRALNRVPFTPPLMAEETRAWLSDYYRAHNTRLSELLGRDLSSWQ
jgi:hypothetical protein